MKIMFMGTPDFAEAVLRALVDAGHDIVAAVTQPDKPKGRGMKMIPPPVKVYAEEKGIPVYQPTTLKDGAFLPVLEEKNPEVIVVAAYGKILPSYVLDFARYGCINAHASVLPRWRGAAPINRAVMAGDKVTGVTAMYMDEGLDTGDIILTKTCEIGDDDNAGDVHDRLASIGGEAIVEALRQLEDGTATRTKQPEDGMIYAEKLTKEEGELDFTLTARELHNKIRGLAPMPCGWTHTPDGRLLKITAAHIADGVPSSVPGEVLSVDGGEIKISVGDGVIAVTGVIPEGKSRMSAADYIRGRKVAKGDILG